MIKYFKNERKSYCQIKNNDYLCNYKFKADVA